MNVRGILGIAAVGVSVMVLAGNSMAQTGPAPEAEKAQIATTPTVKPSRFIDGQAAAAIWKMRPRADETTAAVAKRAENRLKQLLARDPKKLNYDTDYWHLLAYLREVPWKQMPESRKRWYLEKMPNSRLTDEQTSALITSVRNTPLFKMTPKQIDAYLGWLREAEPDLRRRVVHLARKNLGQPYDIYLLGEFPYEVHDPDPTYMLGKGDCVVFSEHVYAMALSKDWSGFYRALQRIRYKDGVVGMTTRNHFTEADWDKNNSWLVEDVTTKIGATSVTQYTEAIDRARFFANFGIGQDIPKETLVDQYIPAEAVPSVLDKLQDGDFVNVVRGRGDGVWVGHVGLIGRAKDGTVNFIHSTQPKSKEQPIMEYVNDNVRLNVNRRKKGSAEFMGFKFLRLRAEDLKDGLPESVAKAGRQPPAIASGAD